MTNPGSGNPYTFTGQSQSSAHERDIDLSSESSHHTLGSGATQASPGNHKHGVEDITGFDPETGVADHQLLANRNDPNAHAQYSLTTHEHPETGLTLTTNAPVDVNAGIAIIGSGTTAARDDHKHRVLTGVPVGPGASAAAGSSSSLAKSDHVHPSHIRTGTVEFESILSGQEVKSVPIANAADELIFITVDHPSSYILAHVNRLTTTTFEIEVRNSATTVNHVGIVINWMAVKTLV